MSDEKMIESEIPVAIGISDITKIYKLYDKPSDRLKETLGLSKKKRYQELYALNKVNFDVKQGETVGIIGTNGSGKSTILKIITGVLTPTSGQLTVNGRISALLELGAGFNMEYTGLENIYLNATMTGFTREEIDARLQSILDFADIGSFIDQPVKTYSSGMFVRLAFAVAINIDPEILIVDEALSVGDVFFQAKCYHKFEEFKKAGKTILFVSHDLGSITKYCDRVVLLNKGVKVAEGEPKEMVDLYKKLLVNHGDDEDVLREYNEGESSGEEESAPEEKKEENGNTGDIAENPLTGILPMNPNTQDYGEHQAKIEFLEIKDANGIVTNAIEKGSEFTIHMRVRFYEDINDPIFAFTFRNLQGTEICGTNTMYENTEFVPPKAGDVRDIYFKQTMTLQGGEYLLSFGCTGFRDGDFRVFHRLYDVLNVSVISSKDAVGFFDMFSRVHVEGGESADE